MGIEIFKELRDTIVLQVSPSSIFREQINHLFRSNNFANYLAAI